MIVLAAKPVSEKIRADIKARAEKFRSSHGRPAQLIVILIGEDPASVIYTRNKGLAAEACSLAHQTLKFPSSVPASVIKAKIDELNADPTVDGILIQRPLPPQFSEAAVAEWVSPEKDVDAFHPMNAGKLYLGLPCLQPCTPSGIMEILKHYQIPLAGKVACVVGRSTIVGKPMAALFLQADATVIQCHSKTKDLASETKKADIVVAAAGKAQLLGKAHLKSGAVVIDVGIHRMPNGSIVGDVLYESLPGHALAATPVPGGVGPMTITQLLANTLQAALLS